MCGSCLHGMFTAPEPSVMSDGDRDEARKLVERWCENEIPQGWQLDSPGHLRTTHDQKLAPVVRIDVHDGRTLIRVDGVPVRITAVEAAIRSVDAGLGPSLARALELALDDGDALRSVLAELRRQLDVLQASDEHDRLAESASDLLDALDGEGRDGGYLPDLLRDAADRIRAAKEQN